MNPHAFRAGLAPDAATNEQGELQALPGPMSDPDPAPPTAGDPAPAHRGPINSFTSNICNLSHLFSTLTES